MKDCLNYRPHWLVIRSMGVLIYVKDPLNLVALRFEKMLLAIMTARQVKL